MSELNESILLNFTPKCAPLAEAFALAMSENLGQLVTCDLPTITIADVDQLMSAGSPSLQTAFSLPNLCPDEAVLAFPESDALILADLASGGDGTDPPDALLDDQMASLATAMSGMILGLANAVGNMLGRSVSPGNCATTVAPLTLPPAFAVTPDALVMEMPYEIGELIQSRLTFYFTPDLANAIVPDDPPAAPAETAGGETASTAGAGFSPFGGSDFQPFDGLASAAADNLPRGIDMIMDIPLEVSVELGRVRMLIKDVLALSSGSIVELERIAGEPVDLLVNGRLLARGEVVVIDDNFGIRLTEIVSPADRISSLGNR
jgi:flagellar motor switch protein FliN/FliY